jgi:single-strand DNA-binding protein
VSFGPSFFSGTGDLIVARGTIRENSYEKDGEQIYTVDLTVSEFSKLASKNEEG